MSIFFKYRIINAERFLRYRNFASVSPCYDNRYLYKALAGVDRAIASLKAFRRRDKDDYALCQSGLNGTRHTKAMSDIINNFNREDAYMYEAYRREEIGPGFERKR